MRLFYEYYAGACNFNSVSPTNIIINESRKPDRIFREQFHIKCSLRVDDNSKKTRYSRYYAKSHTLFVLITQHKGAKSDNI